MKGNLTKIDNIWFIQYDFGKGVGIKEYPLHPDDVTKHSDYLFEGGNVEFKLDNFECAIEDWITVATITKTEAFDKEGNAVTRGYVEPTESWDAILNLWYQEQENRQPSFFIEWLKEHYNSPTKK